MKWPFKTPNAPRVTNISILSHRYQYIIKRTGYENLQYDHLREITSIFDLYLYDMYGDQSGEIVGRYWGFKG